MLRVCSVCLDWASPSLSESCADRLEEKDEEADLGNSDEEDGRMRLRSLADPIAVLGRMDAPPLP